MDNMRLFNASSLFNADAGVEMLTILSDPEQLKKKIIEIKKMILSVYNFKAYNMPADFTSSPYIIATNHLTDSDAPLIMSYYYEVMSKVKETYPTLFVFAKENCFNGVSIPKELTPILAHESVFPVNRNNAGGAMASIKTAVKWFGEGEVPKHFLIFAQGTIYDINKDKSEDIEPGAFWIAKMLGIPVLPAFIEQAVEGEENRMMFGEPISIPKDCRDFSEQKQLWLDRVINAQNQLETVTGKAARVTELDEDHQTRKRIKPTM